MEKIQLLKGLVLGMVYDLGYTQESVLVLGAV